MRIRLPGAVFTILYAVEETTGPTGPWREVARFETRELAEWAYPSAARPTGDRAIARASGAGGSFRIVPVQA